jgi:hypothetical protein
MQHACGREKEIDDIKKAIFGNGRPGLKEDMSTVKTTVEILTSNISNISKKMDMLIDYHSQNKGRIQVKTQVKNYNRWLVGALIAMASVIATLIAIR